MLPTLTREVHERWLNKKACKHEAHTVPGPKYHNYSRSIESGHCTGSEHWIALNELLGLLGILSGL